MTKQEAIEQLNDLIREAQSHLDGGVDDDIYESDAEALRMRIEALTDKWIPCSERLPERGQEVLVTIWGSDILVPKDGEALAACAARIRKEVRYVTLGHRDKEDGGWNGANGYPMMVTPVAWMPLPEAYEGEV